jgi:asparagine synthase (glutamine-hydrolysing)
MCGIFGLIDKGGVDIATLRKMGRHIQHRGPDGEGFVLIDSVAGAALACAGPQTPAEVLTKSTPSQPTAHLAQARAFPATIGFGHRRLAIVDLSPGGHQPMTNPANGTWIVFNGEIYNHIELRAELEREGHVFYSHSDTEVILKAYEAWGTACLDRFNGMFAIVIFDLRRRRLFIARDRFGVKPLYIWRFQGGFAFASEIKAFLADERFSAQPNIGRLAEYLDEGPAEHDIDTAFIGVQRLAAASFIEADLDDVISGSCTVRTWWKLNPNSSNETWNAVNARRHADRYAELLDSSVALRLRADVTVGSALSGGLDSTSVVWLIAQQAAAQGRVGRQETFSTVYRSPGTEHCDESGYIQRAAEKLGVQMNTIEPHAEDVPAEHARVIWAMDTPPESTCMSGWHTFKLVQRSGIKVTLDGQGADEQLAGYKSYLAIQLAERGVAALGELPALLRVHERRIALGAIGAALAAPTAAALSGFASARRRRVLGQLRRGLNAALADDCFHGLSNLIHYGDRTSMAFGVESRMPFLDFRLAEFLTQLPACYKIHDGWTKHIARAAFDGKLPEDIVWRKDKMGWPIPEETWERGPLASWFARPKARESLQAMDDLGLGAPFRQALASPSITTRIRALNLDAWRKTFLDGGWKEFVA